MSKVKDLEAQIDLVTAEIRAGQARAYELIKVFTLLSAVRTARGDGDPETLAAIKDAADEARILGDRIRSLVAEQTRLASEIRAAVSGTALRPLKLPQVGAGNA